MLAGVKPLASPMIRALSVLVGLVLVHPEAAQACSCVMPTFEEQRAQSAAIFEGRVDAIRADGDEVVVVFHVTQAWRGVTTERVEIRTASSSAACGYAFEVGTHYLVYAGRRNEGPLAVSLCSRTAPADDANDDRQLLGSGTIPVEVSDEGGTEPEGRRAPPATRAGCASCATSAARAPTGFLVWSFLAGLALARRSRARS